jgi:hypothetical protein
MSDQEEQSPRKWTTRLIEGARVQGTIFGLPVAFISLADLIVNKQATGRDSDIEHLKHMQGDVNPKPSP